MSRNQKRIGRDRDRASSLFGGGALIFGIVGLFAVAGLTTALTAHVAAAPADPTIACRGDPSLTLTLSNPPASDRPLQVLSLTWKAVNDEDSGFAGYWALDNYVSTLHVWLLRSGPNAGEYYVWKTYSGIFQVPQGALSPGETGTTPNQVLEPTAGYGIMKGGYYAYIASAEQFTPGKLAVTGNLGTFNYGGTTADILLGTYGAGQVGPTTVYSWYSAYFTPAASTDFSYGDSGNAWGWTYTLNSDFYTSLGSTTSTNMWCNFGAGAYGDIVTAA